MLTVVGGTHPDSLTCDSIRWPGSVESVEQFVGTASDRSNNQGAQVPYGTRGSVPNGRNGSAPPIG